MSTGDKQIVDSFGREINYLRLAVTDRCNLRCFYCMPESGINFVNRKYLLSFEEMEYLLAAAARRGINKIRITGGEPFVRKGLMEFLERASQIEGIDKISITTNGSLTDTYIPRLKKAGIKHINLSLDSLDRQRFLDITRRDLFDQVMDTYRRLLDEGFDLKVNMVVMDGRNIEDIYPMLELGRSDNVSIRFIEEMPFNGTPGQGNATFWPSKQILEHIQKEYPNIEKLQSPSGSTSENYRIDGFKGSFGIIAAYTRTFCGSCNRIRITPLGELRNCLYSGNGISIRDVMRAGASIDELGEALQNAVLKKPKDGFAAEKEREQDPVHESMATIGG